MAAVALEPLTRSLGGVILISGGLYDVYPCPPLMSWMFLIPETSDLAAELPPTPVELYIETFGAKLSSYPDPPFLIMIASISPLTPILVTASAPDPTDGETYSIDLIW